LIVIVKTVLYPIINVPVHLIEPPRVRLEAIYGQCLLPMLSLYATGISVIAVVIGLIRRDG
jgi:hypothetical protein